MNIPPETARAQGHHGIKGAVHGLKGGRPRLNLTDEERVERRRKQQEAYRRRKGIPPKTVLTWEERKERSDRLHQKRWNEEYRRVWGKWPGEPLTAGEFAKRQGAFRRWVRECQNRRFPLDWSVTFVRRHFREERRRQRAEEQQSLDAKPRQRTAERKVQAQIIRRVPQGSPPAPSLPYDDFDLSELIRSSPAAPKVGRNSPCPCGSGRKFKKCCGP